MSQPATPRAFGRYQVIGPIGTGGMAQVYKGYDPTLDREVAIKVVSRGEYDAAFNERFRREARAVATLRHPNIVQIHDYGEHEGSHYMVMELVHGADLGHHLVSLRAQRKQPSPLQVQSIVDQVAAGLDYAHARRIIHRDVKPSNILLGDDGAVVLTDFGLVLKVDPGVEPTRGQSFGTPEYIAPEQAMDGAWATPRSDIYSLGVVLYLMLTGTLPFQSDTPLQTALKHISDTPVRPREVNPTLSLAVEAVILKGMAKEPDKRYVSAGEMARALRAAWRDQLAAAVDLTPEALPAVAARPAAASQSRRRRASPSGVVGAIALVAIAALVIVAVGLALVFVGQPDWRSFFFGAPPATALPTTAQTLAPESTSTGTTTPVATATLPPTLKAAAPITLTLAMTATRTQAPYHSAPTATPTQPPWTGPLKLEAYPVAEQCVSHKPRVWATWVKMWAEGGTGVYVYYIDDVAVAGPMTGEYIYVLNVTDGSPYKALRLSVVSAGVPLKNPIALWIEAPPGC